MSRLNQRTGSGNLSLVVSALTAVPPVTGCPAKQDAPMRQGWFEEEVGYVSEMPVALGIATSELEKGRAP